MVSLYLTENTSQSVLLYGETQDICCELRTEHTSTLCGRCGGLLKRGSRYNILRTSGPCAVLWCMTHSVSSFSLLYTSPLSSYHCCVIPDSGLGLRPAVSTDILRGFPQPPHRIFRIPLPIRPLSLCSLDAALRTVDSVVK